MRQIIRIPLLLWIVLFVGVPSSSWAKVYRVDYVIDGDTLKLENGQKVRLIGVDTPETENNAKAKRDSKASGKDIAVLKDMGQRSKSFVRKLVEGRDVELRFDIQQRDRYGRLLAYVLIPKSELKDLPEYKWYDKDYIHLNAELMSQGYGMPYTVTPNTQHAFEFELLYRKARKESKGLWDQTVAKKTEATQFQKFIDKIKFQIQQWFPL